MYDQRRGGTSNQQSRPGQLRPMHACMYMCLNYWAQSSRGKLQHYSVYVRLTIGAVFRDLGFSFVPRGNRGTHTLHALNCTYAWLRMATQRAGVPIHKPVPMQHRVRGGCHRRAYCQNLLTASSYSQPSLWGSAPSSQRPPARQTHDPHPYPASRRTTGRLG
jgi:hypothetical protein